MEMRKGGCCWSIKEFFFRNTAAGQEITPLGARSRARNAICSRWMEVKIAASEATLNLQLFVILIKQLYAAHILFPS